MTLDDAFASIADLGFLVNNCYQLDDGSWRVSLRRPVFGGDYLTGFGEGDDLQTALELAEAQIGEAEFHAERAVSASIAPSPEPSARRLSLAGLGLVRASEPLTRRTLK